MKRQYINPETSISALFFDALMDGNEGQLIMSSPPHVSGDPNAPAPARRLYI